MGPGTEPGPRPREPPRRSLQIGRSGAARVKSMRQLTDILSTRSPWSFGLCPLDEAKPRMTRGGSRLALRRLASGALLVITVAGGLAWAEPAPAPTLSEDAAAERAEREALLALVRRERAPAKDQEAVLDISGQPYLGSDQAPVVLLEFTDFHCPYCRRHMLKVLPSLLQEYVNCGKLRYVFFDFPVAAKHPNAFDAALAARCASDQRRYWDVHNWLFESSQWFDRERLLGRVNAVGLDVPEFLACLDSGKYADAVRSNLERGVQLLVRGTPTFFVGRPGNQPDEVFVVRRITGAQPFELFQRELEGQMAATDGSLAPPAAQTACCETGGQVRLEP